MKKFSIILIVVMVMAFGLILNSCDFSPMSGERFVSVNINPQVDFLVKDGVVESVFAGNEDGLVLLANEDFIGLKIESASQKVVQLAVEMGYIGLDEKGNQVEVTVVDENGNNDDIGFAKIQKTVNRYFENNGIYGCVSQENLDKYLELANQLNRPLGHIKMMMLAIERSDKTLEEVKDLPVWELRKLINNNENGANKPNCDNECVNKKEDRIKQNKNNLQKHQNEFKSNKKGKQQQVKKWQENQLVAIV